MPSSTGHRATIDSNAWLRSAGPCRARLSALAAASLVALACAPAPALAQAQTEATQITITGSRIKSLAVTSTSPVSQTSGEQIGLLRAASVEDFSAKLPQLAGGLTSGAAGANGDALGAQTLDLRNLGQNRTLVLINGTRAVPFSFRNAVDVNFIPATLIQRVDVLTGGAAAVYGADAVAGVVNFIMKDRFDGLQLQASHRGSDGGGEQSSVNFTGGLSLGNRGSVVGYLEYTKRGELLAGEHSWSLANPTRVAPRGGNFTDVASGQRFSVDDAGNFTTAAQTADYTPQFLLVSPLERVNASSFFRFDLSDRAQLYGRVMLSKVKVSGAPTNGQNPPVVNAAYDINQSNPFIPAAGRPLLTFVNGVARVNIERSLGELGVLTAVNDRKTQQAQFGVRGPITDAIGWDVYVQQGSAKEDITIEGDALASEFAGLVNTVNLFGPGADLSSIARPFSLGSRKRTQTVAAASVTGDSSDFFKLPAGAVGFAVGVEQRREKGSYITDPGINQSFRPAALVAIPLPPSVRANEVYAELLVPVLAKLPFIENLSVEGAWRRSDYEKSVGASNSYDTSKLGLSWTVVPSVRIRATDQTTIRDPNFGEFAGAISSIPFASLVNVARLRPRYQGDPCVLGTGNAAQCARFGAPAVGSYDSLNAANLTGGYFFGGNPDIRAEKGKSQTLGIVLQPTAVQGLALSLDYYRIEITDAVGQVQPIDALTSCYITDPRADNPLCAAVTRDAATGRIKDGFPIDRNLAVIKQSGFDIDASYRQNAPFGLTGHRAVWQYQASVVSDYTIQRNPVLDPIDCKGTYGFRCSSDAVSLVMPDYRHRVSLAWTIGEHTAQFGWKRIGKVNDSAVGSTGSIPAHDTFDLNFSVATPVKGLRVNFGIDNITDKEPPTGMTNPGVFNTFTDTYSALGRSYGLSATMKF
ncbi:MAG TPA: TonB-dependent receptor [Rubrivivax sp.]|nr:TonB-dependent receptor [Rubrivivax sp.]